MKELTFKGFLKQYVGQLSQSGATGLYQLCREANENPRLREPLLLYALYSGKKDVLLKAMKNEKREAEYQSFFTKYELGSVDEALHADRMPEDFQKVWESYQYQRNRLKFDNDTKRLMRQKILQLQAQKGVSNYRLYTDLHLNPGNINAWLKHDDSSKLSLATARAVLQYLERK